MQAADREHPSGPSTRDALSALRLVAADVLVFTGVPPAEAAAAVRAGTDRLDVPAPPRLPRLPRFSRLRHHRRH